MLTIKSLSFAQKHKREFDAIISVEDPQARSKRVLRFHNKPHPDQLVLRLEDIDRCHPQLAGAAVHHVERAISFAREYANANLLVHCRAGVCRSTALGLAILADRLGHGNEAAAVQTLLSTNPDAAPTLCIVDMADDVLKRNGALSSAWGTIETNSRELAEFRTVKLKALEKEPHLYALRPDIGYFPARRCKPTTLAFFTE